MLTSAVKPPKIQILNMRGDISKNKLYVKYAFNFGITEKTVPVVDMRTGEETEKEEIQYEYYQYVSEVEFDLILKPFLPQLLQNMYQQLEPVITERITANATEIPKQIDWK